MAVLVSGATSQIGRFLLPRLVAAGVPVIAVSRQPQSAQPGVQWLQGSLPQALQQLPAQALDAIVSFSPLMDWADWLGRQYSAPARLIVATSSMSALSKQHSAQPEEQALAASLQAGEQRVMEHARRLDMQCTIFRPTLIYGAGIDRSLAPIVAAARRRRLFPIPMGRGLRQPVHADDIARAVIQVLNGSAPQGGLFQIGGGERLNYRQMFQRVRASMGQRTAPVYLPVGALRALAALVPSMRGPVSRLDEDLIADNTQLERQLRIRPRPFQPSCDCWQPMDEAMARERIARAPDGH